MSKDKPEVKPEPEEVPALTPATYKVVGFDKGVTEAYFPEMARSFVLADITPDQFEALHMLGCKHVQKTRNK